MNSNSELLFVTLVITAIAFTSANPLRRFKNEIECREAQKTEQQCYRLEAGLLKNHSCYLDSYDMQWRSCSELCTRDHIGISTAMTMKCRDYCPWYLEKECHKVAPDTQTDSEKIRKLEADMNQVLLNQMHQRRLLVQLRSYILEHHDFVSSNSSTKAEQVLPPLND